jgi:hypothetical protein
MLNYMLKYLIVKGGEVNKMRKMSLLVMVLMAVCGMASYALAATTVTATVSATVNTDFNIAFYPRPSMNETDANITFPTGVITFPAIKGNETIVYPTGRSQGDGKSDIGLLGLSNLPNGGTQWGIEMQMSGNIPPDNIVVYVPANAYFRNTTPATALATAKTAGWYKAETSQVVLYRADVNHLLTDPWGTLLTLSFAIIPSGKFTDGTRVVCNGNPLPAGSYSGSALFTMATGI